MALFPGWLLVGWDIKWPELDNEIYFDHHSPEGISLKNRLDAINYSYFYQSENIAVGALSVKEVMEEWLNSEGHCRNLLQAKLTHFGSAQYGIYWTQELVGK